MRTPYEMLGRVMAVNSMFTGSSGSLGEFRAGAIAAWLGPVPSALIGGVGAITGMVGWVFLVFPFRRGGQLAALGAVGGWGREKENTKDNGNLPGRDAAYEPDKLLLRP